MTLPSFPLTVPDPGGRADAVIAAALDGLTRSAAQRWLDEGRVTLNGRPLKKKRPPPARGHGAPHAPPAPAH